MMVQGGSTGAMRALIEAGPQAHPRGDRGRERRAQAHREVASQGAKGLSLGDSPGLAAIAIKATLEGLRGKVLPQKISVPIPAADDATLKDGENYYSKLSDNFSRPTNFRLAASISRASKS